jgi:hypothetical protein
VTTVIYTTHGKAEAHAWDQLHQRADGTAPFGSIIGANCPSSKAP